MEKHSIQVQEINHSGRSIFSNTYTVDVFSVSGHICWRTSQITIGELHWKIIGLWGEAEGICARDITSEEKEQGIPGAMQCLSCLLEGPWCVSQVSLNCLS